VEQHLLVAVHGVQRQLAHGSLDPADAGGNGRLALDAEGTHLSGVIHMGAAAEFHGHAAHFHHADHVAILLAEHGHSALLLGLLNGKDLRHHGDALQNGIVDDLIHLRKLLRGNGLKVGEVEPQPVGLHQRAGLMHMVAQHLLQCSVQQVRGAVGTPDALAAFGIDGGRYSLPHLELAGDHLAVVHELAALVLLDVIDLKSGIAAGDDAVVGHLTAHFSVERRLVQHHNALHAAHQLLGLLVFHYQRNDFSIVYGIMVIAHKLRGGNVLAELHTGPAQIAQSFPGLTGAGLLFLHLPVESGAVQRHALVLHHLHRQVNGEAVGIVQLESVRAGEGGLPLFLVLSQQLIEDSHAAVNGLGEVLLLHPDDLGDIGLPLPQFGIVAFVFVNNGVHHLIQEGLVDAQQLAVAGGPAQQAAQHVAPALVGGQHTVADHEAGGTDMVGDDPEGYVLLLALAVAGTGDLRNLIGNVHHGVHIEQRVHILADNSQTLKAHTGIDVLLLQHSVVVMTIVVKLREHQIPNFHIAVAVATHSAAGLAAAVLLTAVIVYLRAGTAGAGAMLPEVVLLAEFEDTVFGNANILVPDAESLFINRCCLITCKYRGIQAIGIQSHPLGRGQKFPSPPNGLFLKVISKGEVAQHLKIGAVAGRVADVFNIAGADALLAGSDPVPGRLLLAGEIGLHRRHTGVDEQQAGITLGNQGKAGQAQMALGLEKVQEHLPQFVEAIVLGFRHIHFLHFYVNFLIFDCKPDFRPEWNRWQRSTAAFLPKNKMLRPGHRGEALLHGTTLIIPHPWGHLSHR